MANGITVESVGAKDRNRKRKRDGELNMGTAWRTANDQRMYSSKLVAELCRVRFTTPQKSQSRLVREAADRALAATARARTRWSRAILSNKRSCSANLVKVIKPKICSPPARRHWHQPTAVERKAKVLGRLIPGCRKVALPTLLEETSDYIAALQMQIRAMSVLAELLSTAGTSAAPSSSSPRS